MQKEQLEMMKKQMQQGRDAITNNPWNVDYNVEQVAKSTGKEGETLLDKAKSFSFWGGEWFEVVYKRSIYKYETKYSQRLRQ